MASFGVIGLGVMGQNLALNIEEHAIPVAVWNYETDWIPRFLQQHPGKKITGCATLAELVQALERPRRILIMIKAGAPVDQTLATLVPLLEAGDVVIDGGNSLFSDTERRQRDLALRNLHFFGTGVSGGEEGARHGPCLMPGGSPAGYAALKPVFEAIAAKTDSGACVTFVGPGGAGHFVKTVHNGIEYGDMQLIAESYDILRRWVGLSAGEIADVFARWNEGRLASFLIELTAKILRTRDPETGRPLVELVLDAAEQKGTGKWTAEVALDLGVAIPTISAAIDARVLSSLKAERVAASKILSGPAAPKLAASEREAAISAVEEALYAAKICSYAQGMNLIRAGSKAYEWNIQLAELARIWKGGCIIRARLLNTIRTAYTQKADLPNLLVDGEIAKTVMAAQAGWRRTVALAQTAGIAVPALGASLTYYDMVRSAELPQNLTQAQRDAFGAHTYVRVDHPERGHIHSEWN